MYSKDKLIVFNYLHKAIAVLNDNSDNCAREIEDEVVINGVGKLTFKLPLNSPKWHYVVQDNLVLYKGQSYVVQNPSLTKSLSDNTISVECYHLGANLEGKLNPMYGKTELVGKSISEIVNTVLLNSGWVMGDTDVPITTKRALIVKEQSIMANIKKIAQLYDCSFIIDANLSHKKIHFKKAATDNMLTVREGVNLRTLTANIDKSGLITRMIVYGGSDPITNRPISIFGATVKDEDGNVVLVNGQPKIHDKTYIEDYSYYLDMGYTQADINARPEYFLKESILPLSDYINKDDLLQDATRMLKESAQPKITVTFDMADAINPESWFTHVPVPNEMIYIYSKDINDKLNIKTTTGYEGKMFQMKVSEVKKNSDKPDSVQITAKNYSQYGGIAQTLISNADTINKLVSSDGTVNTSKLQGWIDILSTQLNSTQSKWYTDDSGNLMFESLDGTSAMMLGGGIYGMANSKNPDGSWQWRTFGTGDGITATEIVAGWLIGGQVKFDLEGGRLLIGNDWASDYVLKFEPATGLKMNFSGNFYSFTPNGFIIKGSNNEVLITENGMANQFNDTIADNVADGYPLVFAPYIDESTSVVHEVLLHYKNMPFRTYSKSAVTANISLTTTASNSSAVQSTTSEAVNVSSTNSHTFTAQSTSGGGGTTATASSSTINLTSTGNGGYTSKSTVSGGSSATTSRSGGGNSTGTTWNSSSTPFTNTSVVTYIGESHNHSLNKPTLTHYHSNSTHTHVTDIASHSHSFDVPDHAHSISMPAHNHSVTLSDHTHSFTVDAHSHSITIPNHGHSVTIPSHAHSITMPSHSHTLEYGILEQAVSNNTSTVWIDGVQRATITAASGTLNITQWMQTVGAHTVEIRSTTLKRVHANLSVKTYMKR